MTFLLRIAWRTLVYIRHKQGITWSGLYIYSRLKLSYYLIIYLII